MGKIRLGICEELALKLRDKFGIKYFVETGTYKAGTTRWAADYFEKVYTIEGWYPFYQKSLGRLSSYENVELLHGDSREILPEILEQLDGPAILWLDAHYLGNSEISKGTPGECPLREELQAVNAAKFNHFVLIDDARYFTGEYRGVSREHWPGTAEIAETLKKAYPKFIIDDFEDVMIAVPPEARQVVMEHMRTLDVRIIVPTSNEYVGVLSGFSYWFNKYWSSRQPVTVIRYNVRPPMLPDNFHNIAVGKQEDYTWASGLRIYLEGLRYYDHIILLLEDYYISKQVNLVYLNYLWQYAQDHPEIQKIDLTGDRLKVPYVDYPEAGDLKLVKSEDDAHFRCSVQAAIWRTDYLIEHLNPAWGAWEFEKHGCNDGKTILGVKTPAVEYVNAVGGAGNKPGQYDHKKIPAWMWLEMVANNLVKDDPERNG